MIWNSRIYSDFTFQLYVMEKKKKDQDKITVEWMTLLGGL